MNSRFGHWFSERLPLRRIACSKNVTAFINDIVSKPELTFDQSLWPLNPVASLNKHGHRHGSFIAVLVAPGAAIVEAYE
jgi:hypothetical protein